MKQLLIYENLVPVNRDQHGGMFFEPTADFSFARDTNSVPVLAGEFPGLAQEYAVVFTDSTEGTLPVAILGARDHENVFVNKDGSWGGRYVPAFVRRYPFAFGADANTPETLTLMVDTGYSGFNAKGKGEVLFLDDGKPAPVLENVMKFLSDYQGGFQRTQLFCKKLEELDLFEGSAVRLPLPDAPDHQITGFKVINREKLKALPPAKVAELFGTDELELIYLHLFSLANLGQVQGRLTAVPKKKAKV